MRECVRERKCVVCACACMCERERERKREKNVRVFVILREQDALKVEPSEGDNVDTEKKSSLGKKQELCDGRRHGTKNDPDLLHFFSPPLPLKSAST